MLEKLRQELQDELENVLQNTISYGIAPDRIGEVSLSAVAETLVIREKWNWITKYEIEETVTLTSDYTLSNNRISKKQGLSFPELPDYPGVPGEFVRGFFGASEETAEKISKREILEDSMFLRFVTDVDSAGLIAIYHTGFDGTTPDLISSILCLDVQLALQEGAVIKQAPSEFILGKSLKPRHFSQLEEQRQVLKKLRWKVRLNEMLFMEYSDQSRYAAEDLFQLKSQPEVERILINYLNYEIPEVRRNVAQALSLPSYQRGFVLGIQIPSKDRFLEPVTIQPETLIEIIDIANRETDLEAIHWFICCLTAQNYTGKLAPFVDKCKELAYDLESRFGEELQEDIQRFKKFLKDL